MMKTILLSSLLGAWTQRAYAQDAEECLCEVCPCPCDCFDRNRVSVLFIPTYGTGDFPAEQNFRFGVHQAAKDFRFNVVENDPGSFFDAADAVDFLKQHGASNKDLAGLITGTTSGAMTAEIDKFLANVPDVPVYVGGGTPPTVVEELRQRTGAPVGMDAGGSMVTDGAHLNRLFHVGSDERKAARLVVEEVLRQGAEKVICLLGDTQNPMFTDRCDAISEYMASIGKSAEFQQVSVMGFAGTFRDSWFKAGGFLDPTFTGLLGIIIHAVDNIMRALGNADDTFEGEIDFSRALWGTFDPRKATAEAIASGSTAITRSFGVDGRIVAAVDPQYYLQGYITAALLYTWKRTTQLPYHDLPTGPVLITKEIPHPLPSVRDDDWFFGALGHERSFRRAEDHIVNGACRDAGYPVCAENEDPAIRSRYPGVSTATPECGCINRQEAVRYKIYHIWSTAFDLIKRFNQAYNDVREAFNITWDRLDFRLSTVTGDPEIEQLMRDMMADPAFDDWGVLGDPYFPNFDNFKDLAATGRPLFLTFHDFFPYENRSIRLINMTGYTGIFRCGLTWLAGADMSGRLGGRYGVTFNPWHHELSFSWNRCFVDGFTGRGVGETQWVFPPDGDRLSETGDWRAFEGTCGDGSGETCKAQIAFTEWNPANLGPNLAQPVYEFMKAHPEVDSIMCPDESTQTVPYLLEYIKKADLENGQPGHTSLAALGGTSTAYAALFKPPANVQGEHSELYKVDHVGDGQPYLAAFVSSLRAALYDSTLRGELLLRDVQTWRVLTPENAAKMKRQLECEAWGDKAFKDAGVEPDEDLKTRGFYYYPVCDYSRCGGEALPCSGHGECVQEEKNLFESRDSAYCVCTEPWTGDYCQNEGQRCDAGWGVFKTPDGAGGFDESCQLCAPGTYQAYDVSPDPCGNCSAGTFAALSGMTTCSLCDAGRFSAVGMGACELCPIAHYLEGKGGTSCSSCEDVIGGAVTAFMGATGPTNCICPLDTFLPINGSACVPCPAGMVCAEGSDERNYKTGAGKFPELKPGYYAPEDDPMFVYQCSSDTRCPGGPPGTCAPNAEGTNCANCASGMARDLSGKCQDCDGVGVAPLLIVIVAAVVALCGIYYRTVMANRSTERRISLFGSTIGTHVLNIVQQIGVIAKMQVPWSEPASGVLKLVGIATIDVELLNFSCFGSVSTVGVYVAKVAVVPATIIVLGLIHAVASFVWHGGKVKERGWAFLGSCGVILMAFNTSISTTILSPFQCVQHPNKEWTLVEYESQLCFSAGEHIGMIVVGVLALSIPVSFFVWVVQLLRAFPRRMSSGDTLFLNTYGFLFNRVKPDTVWFMLLVLIRSVTVALVPTIPNAVVQVIVMMVITVVFLVLTSVVWPWRLDVVNALEITSISGIGGLVFLSAFLIPDIEIDSVSETIAAFIIISLLVFPVGAIYVFFLHLRPAKMIEFFIACSRSAAGARARLLHLSLTERSDIIKGKIFLEADSLRDVDTSFGFVGNDTGTLVVLCSGDVFTRATCLGQITTAFLKKVKTCPVYLADFSAPGADTIESFAQKMDFRYLTQSGFRVNQVEEAIRWFLVLPPLTLPKTDRKSMALLASRLVEPGSASPASSAEGAGKTCTESIVILVDSSDQEATAAAQVMARLLAPGLSGASPVLYSELPRDASSSIPAKQGTAVAALLLLCTTGCFAKTEYLLGLIWAMQNKAAFAVAVAVEDTFKFQTESFCSALDDDLKHICLCLSSSASTEPLAEYVTAILEGGRCPFSAQGSMEELQRQVRTIQILLGARAAANVEVSGAYQAATEIANKASGVSSVDVEDRREARSFVL